MKGGLLTLLASKPVSQPVPPHFRLDLHCSYHQGPGHDMDHCNALRHAIQDLIDQGLVNLGQPTVTINLLPAYSTHTVSLPLVDIHHIDLIEDDIIHMLSWDDGLPESIVLYDSSEVDGISLGPQFILWQEDDDLEGRDIQITTHSGRIAQPPPPAVRPFEGATLIKVETVTTLARLIHMMMANRVTCIVFSDNNFPLEGLDHIRPLYITVGYSAHRVSSIMLDNGSTLNVCPLATTIALGFTPSEFGPSTQIVRTYDSTKREVINTLVIDLLIGPVTFSTLFQKVKFIHEGQVIMTLEIEDFCRDFVALSFDQHNSTVVLDIMRGMTFLPGMSKTSFEDVSSENEWLEFLSLGVKEARTKIKVHQLIEPQSTEHTPVGHEIKLVPLPGTIERTRISWYTNWAQIKEVTDDGVIVDPIEMIDGVVPHDEYRDEMDMMTMSQITSIVQLRPISPFDAFGVSTTEVVEET
ncbi:hypothetical protein CK203_053912 [Vitis vinifera]|uniref:Uncharacterized protein n=1 Tax=Vitis vinifera TaxID=29760 RepID=A0A438GSL5_VITVI|nr:hypothetical protein CK203_053912 [Vitis vinifera]